MFVDSSHESPELVAVDNNAFEAVALDGELFDCWPGTDNILYGCGVYSGLGAKKEIRVARQSVRKAFLGRDQLYFESDGHGLACVGDFEESVFYNPRGDDVADREGSRERIFGVRFGALCNLLACVTEHRDVVHIHVRGQFA
jgi:hypothetical protein